jgi:hypothetical protein
MTCIRTIITLLALALATPAVGSAQAAAASGSGSGSGSADIEMGATQASQVETNAGASSSRVHTSAPVIHDSGVRIALQARLDALNLLAFSQPDADMLNGGSVGRRLLVPMVAPGVRLVDGKLFAGLGLGLAGVSTGNNTSRSGWSLDPVVTYDLLRDQVAALSLVGMLNFARLSRTEVCNANVCMDQNNSLFGWGLSVGAGLRGLISQGLSLGGEFGWGFLDLAPGAGGGHTFVHGLFGNIFLEASVGI